MSVLIGLEGPIGHIPCHAILWSTFDGASHDRNPQEVERHQTQAVDKSAKKQMKTEERRKAKSVKTEQRALDKRLHAEIKAKAREERRLEKEQDRQAIAEEKTVDAGKRTTYIAIKERGEAVSHRLRQKASGFFSGHQTASAKETVPNSTNNTTSRI